MFKAVMTVRDCRAQYRELESAWINQKLSDYAAIPPLVNAQ
jgi:hypothetical protein